MLGYDLDDLFRLFRHHCDVSKCCLDRSSVPPLYMFTRTAQANVEYRLWNVLVVCPRGYVRTTCTVGTALFVLTPFYLTVRTEIPNDWIPNLVISCIRLMRLDWTCSVFILVLVPFASNYRVDL